MDHQVVHTTLGRFRIRIPQVANDYEYANKLNHLIESLSFVTSVRINHAARSVIINYEANVISTAAAQEGVFTCINQASISVINEPALVETDPLEQPQTNSWQDLSLPFVSVGVALLAAPFELPFLFVAAAIGGAAMPWFNRAADSIITYRQPNIDLLDSLWMTLQTLQGQFFAPALKTSLVEIRRSFRGTAVQTQTQQALEMLNCLEQHAWVERDGQEQLIPVADLQSGDCVIVHSGELIPVDGRIIQGVALIDTCNLTGEVSPVTVRAGQDVYASTLVVEGQLYILSQRTGKNTRAGLIADLIRSEPVHDTQIGVFQAELVRNAIVPTIFLGVTIFALTGNVGAAISPFQLDFGSGIPISLQTTILAALTDTVRDGVYIRSGGALEVLARLDTIILDNIDVSSLRTGAIAALCERGIDVYVFIDDELQVASAVAERLGLDSSHIHAAAFSEAKAELIFELQRHGRTVAFIGDSTKDDAAFACADISISFATEHGDITHAAADVVLLENLQGLTHAIDVAQRALEIVYQNTALIVIPNLIVQIGGGIFLGLNPVVNVIVNNSSAFIAEFLMSSQPLSRTSATTSADRLTKEPRTANPPVLVPVA